MNKIFLAITSLLLLTACLKDDSIKDYSKENEEQIQEYLANNNLEATKDEYGIYHIIEEEGTGENPIDSDIVKISYDAYLTSGDTINSTNGDSSYLTLQDIILGLRAGIPNFKKGGGGKIIIPSRHAFQDGSVIIFDIELQDIYDNIDDANDAEIQDYIIENELTESAIQGGSGLYYIIEEEGTGNYPSNTSNVVVNYKGYFTDGVIFDESEGDSGILFNLQNVIEGWTDGIPYFKEGAKGKLIIPSRLGYGKYHNGIIPGGSVLIFDIELISIIEEEE